MKCELTEVPLANGKSQYVCRYGDSHVGTSSAVLGKMPRRSPCRGPLRPVDEREIAAFEERKERELGDIAAEILKRTGVAATYKTVLSWVRGIPISEIVCGGCRERQEFLNNVSRRFRRWWNAGKGA
jgi:hypothetical protein